LTLFKLKILIQPEWAPLAPQAREPVLAHAAQSIATPLGLGRSVCLFHLSVCSITEKLRTDFDEFLEGNGIIQESRAGSGGMRISPLAMAGRHR